MFVKSKDYKKHKGFTLVELSIVIVIIGLIVAGVVGGQALVKQSRLRGVVTDINKYTIAHNAFKLEYDALPGDFNKAADFWGAQVASGNGNGHITYADNEPLAYWEHLQMAGLIDGSYTGLPEAGLYRALGVNVPKSDFSNDAGFIVTSPSYNIYDVTTARKPLSIQISGGSTSCNSGLNGYVFTAREANAIDSKADDGFPSSGRWYIVEGAIPSSCFPMIGCVMDDHRVSLSTTYNFTNEIASCRMLHWLKK